MAGNRHGRGEGTGSLWHDTLEPDDDARPRPALRGDAAVDVAIVGAGFTGLWTAYSLIDRDPSLRVAVLERETASFGASGRNGGWCVGDQAAPLPALERAGGTGAAARMVRAVQGCVDVIGDVVAAEGIDCGFAKSGALILASNRAQLQRLSARPAEYERYGLDGTYEVWDAARTREVVRAESVIGALHTPHAAAVHPARLARGIARAAERRGVTVYEHTTVTGIAPGRVTTTHGTVRADLIVRATEAYTRTLEGERRTTLPVGNIVIATEPIDAGTWAQIGLAGRELFEDGRTMVGYGQRTADDRIVWGGLSASYRWASAIPPTPMQSDRIARRLRDRLVAMFPVLAGVGVSHHWGGVLGIARDLRPSVGLDRANGLAWAGGYFGSGVAIANLAGRTLADLICGDETDRTSLAWVGHRSRSWEPEPLRWSAAHAATTAAHVSDWRDRRRA